MIITLSDKDETTIDINKLVAVWKGRHEDFRKIRICANNKVSLVLHYKTKADRNEDYGILVKAWGVESNQ